MMSLPPTSSSSLAVWSFLSAAVLALQAAALVVAPRLLLFLSRSPRDALTPLEAFLALHFALFLFALAFAVLLNTPSQRAPLPSVEDAAATQPLLVPLTLAACVSAFLAWNADDVGSLSTIFFFACATMGLWGLWEIVFANSSAVSKTTGADKHTSAFMFGNKAAASSQKKQMRRKEYTS